MMPSSEDLSQAKLPRSDLAKERAILTSRKMRLEGHLSHLEALETEIGSSAALDQVRLNIAELLRSAKERINDIDSCKTCNKCW